MTDFIKNAETPKESELDRIDEKTKQLLKTVKEKASSTVAAMAQKPEDVAGYIMQAITSSNPQFRYQTNKLYSTAIQQKLIDPTGKDVLAFIDSFKNH